MNVYCAGPLFNDAERVEMQQIAHVIEKDGHEEYRNIMLRHLDLEHLIRHG